MSANKWFLTFHLIGIVIYLGGLLNLSRILGYHAKEEREVRIRMSRMEKRMYFFVNLPGLAVMLIFGLLMLFGVGRENGSGEGVMNYLRPNEQVLVHKADIDDDQATVFHKAIIEESFKQEKVGDQWVATFDARVVNAEGDIVVASINPIKANQELALRKQRTPWGPTFHPKLVLFLVLLLLDLMVMMQILRMSKDPDFLPHPRRFKILHGCIALIMIAMIVLVKTKILGGS